MQDLSNDRLGLLFRKACANEIELIASLVNSAYRGDSSRQGWTNEADLLMGQRTNQKEVASLIDAEGSAILLGFQHPE